MGFLHKLWDETLAGPAPDTGLGKLRKYNSFSSARSSAAAPVVPPPTTITAATSPVTRSITILRTNSSGLRDINVSADSGSVPSSPAGSNTPTSPFSSTTPRGDFKKLTRRRSTSEALQRAEPKSPTGYDWIVLSALDR